MLVHVTGSHAYLFPRPIKGVAREAIEEVSGYLSLPACPTPRNPTLTKDDHLFVQSRGCKDADREIPHY